MVESRFDRRQEIDPAGELYRQVADFLTQEVERSPERLEEMRSFQRYVLLMQQLIPWQTSFFVQDQASYLLERALELPILPSTPTTLPSPGRVIAVGEHMSVTVAEAGECWPDNKRRSLELDDGTVIEQDTPAGRIDIVRNLSRLDPETSVIAFTRQLITSSISSLRELAGLSESEDRRLVGLEVFGGTSHLARMGERFGFTVFDIENKEDRRIATNVSKQVALKVSENNEAWKDLATNYKPAKVAFISRPKLVSLFGSDGPENIREAIRR